MIGPVRIQILTSVGLLASAIGLRAQEQQEQPHPSPVFAVWSEDTQVPAICVGRPEWFVTVVPSSVDLDSEQAVLLKKGDLQAESQVIFFDKSRQLCVLKAGENTFAASPVPLASDPFPRAGLQLHCYYTAGSCRSAVAGKDFFYNGVVLAIPFLRVKVAEAEKFCSIGVPLMSANGEIVGIASERDLDRDDEAHVIPAAQIRKVILDLEEFDRSAPAWVGLIFHEQSSTPVVVGVKEDSPASKAGFAAGDVILSLNGSEIEELIDLCDAPFNLPAGVPAKVGVLRGLDEITLEVTPTFPQAAATP